MMQLARSATLVASLLFTSVATASAERACLPLRTFTPEECQQFETQYGVNWWKAMGLIPGPQTPADWVERPAGDSAIAVFSPQQFWDPRACASNTIDRRGPKGKQVQAVRLLTELDACYTEHRRCGELEAGIDGAVVWIACDCGARIARRDPALQQDPEQAVDHFFAHVVGESFRNDDGSDRQAIIPRCRVGDLLVLEPEPDNPRDINAIRVLRRNGEQIGYLEREFAGQVVPRTAKGWGFHALVAGVGRSKGGLYGMALLMVVENDGASDEEVAAYGRRVLARDREIEASDTGAAPGRRAGGQSASSDRLVLVIAIAVIGLAVALVLLR